MNIGFEVLAEQSGALIFLQDEKCVKGSVQRPVPAQSLH
jgi:hypothetical protein